MRGKIIELVWLIATVTLILTLILLITIYIDFGIGYLLSLALIPSVGGISLGVFDHFLKPKLQSHR